MTHFPGPWSVNGTAIIGSDHGKRYVIARANNPAFTPEANGANARLLAQSPVMLELLEKALTFVDAYRRISGGDGDLTAWNIRHVIALARGTKEAS